MTAVICDLIKLKQLLQELRCKEDEPNEIVQHSAALNIILFTKHLEIDSHFI